ncbi:MAG: ATP-binding domain-containing protein, partial [Oscillospiraceae bacterium]|nr:ATP-binding domain-containing protein [Oscillospiraceae bacterium]
FVALIEECADLLTTLSLPEFYDELLIRTGYLTMLEEKGDVESRTRAENVRELRSNLVNYTQNVDAPTLAGFLEEISLYTDIEQYDPDADAVVMMTMHSAKGLEFPHVFLVGLEDGLFPSVRSIGEQEDMEEERRLCYVAITRAKETLTISYAKQRMLYGHTTFGRPSRFLMELPPACVDAPARSAPQRPTFAEFGFESQMRKPAAAKPAFAGTQRKASVEFLPGNMVEHRAFGRGMVLTATKMGGDTLLEIAFDNHGTKKLLANSASAHMTKK